MRAPHALHTRTHCSFDPMHTPCMHACMPPPIPCTCRWPKRSRCYSPVSLKRECLEESAPTPSARERPPARGKGRAGPVLAAVAGGGAGGENSARNSKSTGACLWRCLAWYLTTTAASSLSGGRTACWPCTALRTTPRLRKRRYSACRVVSWVNFTSLRSTSQILFCATPLLCNVVGHAPDVLNQTYPRQTYVERTSSLN